MKIMSFRIDPELLRKAKERAKQEGRTLGGQIRYLLELFISKK